MPTDETVSRVITPITPLIFAAHNRIVIRQPSVRQILEHLFDFVVLQFDTSSKCKKGRNFRFLKSPGLADLIFCCLFSLLSRVSPPVFNNTYINLEIPSNCGSGPVSRSKMAFVINGKIKKFPSLKSPESFDDTAFEAVSSKLADHDGPSDRGRTCGLMVPKGAIILFLLIYSNF